MMTDSQLLAAVDGLIEFIHAWRASLYKEPLSQQNEDNLWSVYSSLDWLDWEGDPPNTDALLGFVKLPRIELCEPTIQILEAVKRTLKTPPPNVDDSPSTRQPREGTESYQIVKLLKKGLADDVIQQRVGCRIKTVSTIRGRYKHLLT